MTVQRFRGWLLTRISGAFLLWLISLSVAAGYACAPLLEVGPPLLTDGGSTSSSQSLPLACSEHPPDAQGSLSKPLPDNSLGLDVDCETPYGVVGRTGSHSVVSLLISLDRLSTGSQPVYLATARLRL